MESCNPISTPFVVNEKLSNVDGYGKEDVAEDRSLVRSLVYLFAKVHI